jgi:pimeloyl-ACP methyl ester carboxylesterase
MMWVLVRDAIVRSDVGMRSWLALAAIATACSHEDAGNEPVAPAPPIHAVYGPGPATPLTPFPSNRYTRPDATTATKLKVDVSAATTGDHLISLYPATVAEIDQIDGFSTIGGVFANFSDDVDDATLKRPIDGYAAADSPMALVDVDDASPEKGKTFGLLPLYFTTADGEYDYTSVDHTVIAQPATPLRPKTKYLFVLTDRVHGRNGAPIAATDDTKALVTGTGGGEYGAALRAALPTLESATKIERGHVVLATMFTTQSVHDELLAHAKTMRAAPPPRVAVDWKVESTDPDGRVRFVARFEAPELRKAKPDGKFEIVDGAPKTQSTAQLEVFLAFSDSKSTAKRPIVFFGHGLGGTKDGTWGTADRLKTLNAAVFGIDAPEHGSRTLRPPSSGATAGFAAALDFFGVDEPSKSFDIGIARDNFRQMAADQLELVRLAASLETLDLLPVGAPDGIPDLDTSHMLYLGHSFGSVMGATIAALAPEIRAATWNVGGAGLMMLLRDSNTFKLLVDALRPAGTPRGEIARFFALTQAIVDPGDPLNYARFVTQEALPGSTGAFVARDVLLQEVVEDTIVPNSTSEMLARALGLPQLTPRYGSIPGLQPAVAPVTANLPAGSTGGIFQFDQADGKPIEHGSLIFSTEGQRQYVAFFQAALAGRAVIIDPFAK